MGASFIVLIAVIAASLVSFSITRMATPSASGLQTHEKNESAFEHVLRTGILRCGYYVFPPVTQRDPNTRALSGFSVDMMDQMVKNAGLKVEWTEETDFGNWLAGLKAGRFDAFCTPMWPDVSMAREVSFTRSMFYAGLSAYARGDDHRFDNNIAAINDPNVTIVAGEGTAMVYLAQTNFPKAKLQLLPQNAPGGSMAENVVTKKADILFWDKNGVHDFLKSNPGSLRSVDPAHPIRVMPFELTVNADETKLRDLLDVGLQSLEDTDYTNMLLKKWEREPGDFYRIQKPYMLQEK